MRDFDPYEFKLTLPRKAISSRQLQYDDPCWCQKTKYESPECILVNAGGSSLVPDGAELPLSSGSAMGGGF